MGPIIVSFLLLNILSM